MPSLSFVRRFWGDEAGATAIEYGLLAALIALGMVVSATATGSEINGIFTAIAAALVVP